MLWYIVGAVVVVWIIAIVRGWGSRQVVDNPGAMSDAQLEFIISQTGKIMDNSQVFSPGYNKAAEKNSAAHAEMMRRHGQPFK